MKKVFLIIVALLLPSFALGQTVLRGNAVPRMQLPKDVKSLDVKDYFIKQPKRIIGKIRSIRGTLIVVQTKTGKAYFAQRKDRLYAGDELHTLKKSKARVRLTTNDVITVSSKSRIVLDDLIDNPQKGKKRTSVNMIRGKAMFYVTRLFKYRNAETSVTTKTATLGVRGTKFGIEVKVADDDYSTSMPLYFADINGGAGLLAANGSPDEVTLVHGFDGTVDVTSTVDGSTQSVSQGQSLELGFSGAGVTHDSDPSVTAAFVAETELPPPADDDSGDEPADGATESGDPAGTNDDEAADDEPADDEPADDEPADDESAADEPADDEPAEGDMGDPDDPGDPGTPEDFGDSPDTIGPETPATPGLPVYSTEWEGSTDGEGFYSAALISTNVATGPVSNNASDDPIYISVDNITSSGSLLTHVLRDAQQADDNANEGTLRLQENNDSTMEATVDYFRPLSEGGPIQVEAPDKRTFTYHYSGAYGDYLEWGYWDNSSGFADGKIGDGGTTLWVSGKAIWHVEGHTTSPDAISHLASNNIQAHYSGGASGVIGDSAGSGTALSGSFSCDIDFGAHSITNFEVNVANNPTNTYKVFITEGSGTLSSSGDFTIFSVGAASVMGTYSGATVMDFTSTEYATGACFGNKAEAVGGIWGGNNTGSHWATGEFHGQQ